MGSFSDDEGFGQINTVDEEDEIFECSSPKPKPWPPVRFSQEKGFVNALALKDLDDSSSSDTLTEVPSSLKAKLLTLRREVNLHYITLCSSC